MRRRKPRLEEEPVTERRQRKTQTYHRSPARLFNQEAQRGEIMISKGKHGKLTSQETPSFTSSRGFRPQCRKETSPEGGENTRVAGKWEDSEGKGEIEKKRGGRVMKRRKRLL